MREHLPGYIKASLGRTFVDLIHLTEQDRSVEFDKTLLFGCAARIWPFNAALVRLSFF